MGTLKPPGNVLLLWAEKIKSLLSHRNTGVFIVTLIILARVLQQIYFFNTLTDMTHQVLAAQHFVDGHGISSASILANDMSQVIYQPLTKWPPGFSLLFIPFYLLLSKNYIAAALILSIGAAILLIYFSRAILKTLGTPDYLVNLFTLLSGFFGYHFYTMPCTDGIGISFFVMGLYYALLLLKSNERTTRNIIALSTSFVICGFIKFMFMPVVCLIPVFLILKGIALKNISLKKAGLTTFTVLIICFAAFFIYQKAVSGSIGYINQPKRGLFPENLQSMFPFITESFIKMESISQVLPVQGKASSFLFHFFQMISLVVFGVILFYCLKKIIKKGVRSVSLREDFFLMSVLASFVIIILLALLSLRVAKEALGFGQFWTYIEEPRYYGLLTVFLQVGVFVLYTVYSSGKKWLLRFLFPALILLMVPEMIRGIVFTSHRIQRFNKEMYGWQYELQFQKTVNKIVIKKQQAGKNKNMVLAGSSNWMTSRASLYTHLPVFAQAGKLNDLISLKTSKPVTLLVLIGEDHLNAYKDFISFKGVQLEGAEYGYYFYTYDMQPK